MYFHDTITSQNGLARRRDMLARAERARLGRQAKSLALAANPPASRRRAWQLVRPLRPQAQL
jgi:hypothetical protein